MPNPDRVRIIFFARHRVLAAVQGGEFRASASALLCSSLSASRFTPKGGGVMDGQCAKCGCPVQPIEDMFPAWCPLCHELEKARISAQALLGPQAPPAKGGSRSRRGKGTRPTSDSTPPSGLKETAEIVV